MKKLEVIPLLQGAWNGLVSSYVNFRVYMFAKVFIQHVSVRRLRAAYLLLRGTHNKQPVWKTWQVFLNL